jgi:hypothetical protein
MHRDRLEKLSFYGLLLLFSGGVIWLQLHNSKVLNTICKEDGFIEYLTSLFYFLASAGFIFANKKHRFKNLFFWFLAAMCFAIAGEEISWGQRIFGIDTPSELNSINVQQEFNLHNIHGIHQHVRFVGVLIVSAICYFIPISNWRLPKLRALYEKWCVPVFPLWLIGLVTVSLLFMVVPRYVFHVTLFNIDEIAEVELSLAFLLYAVSFISIGGFFFNRPQTTKNCTPILPGRHNRSSRVMGDR